MQYYKSVTEALAAKWPLSYAAACQTYYTAPDWTKTREDGTNDAGYFLAGIEQAAEMAISRFEHKGVSREQLDKVFAREIMYHARRGKQFRRACAALSTCFKALVIERPERFYTPAKRG